MKYKTVLLFTLIVTASASSVFADYIHLKDGTLLKGKVIRVSESSIEYDPDGDIPFDSVNRADVEKIVYDNGKSVIISGSAASNAVSEKTSEKARETVPGNVSGIPGFHRHDGFFFRGSIGYGYTSSTVKSSYGDFKISGLNSNLGLQFGGAIVDNIIPFIELRSIATGNQATTSYGGKNYKYPDKKQSAGDFGLGIGLCVYIPETQFFISGAYYSHASTYEGDFVDEPTKNGKAFSLSAGYELWVSDNWSIGLTAFYYYGKASFDKNSYSNENSKYYQFSDSVYKSFGIGVSFTYN